MLYTRFVIGEETLSSTSAFTFSHRAIFPNTIISFILGVLLLGIEAWTIGRCRDHQRRINGSSGHLMIGATYPVVALAGSDRNLGGALSPIVPVVAESPSAT